MSTRTVTLDLADLSDGDELTIRLLFGTAPEPAAPKPPDDIAAMLRRFHTYGDPAAIDALFDGLRGLGFTPETANSRDKSKLPAYLRWLDRNGHVGTANTKSFEVARRVAESDPAFRDALLRVPGSYVRNSGTIYLPASTVAEVQVVLTVLRPLTGS